MKLTTKMRYGTRVLVTLGWVFPDRTLSITKLAAMQRVTVKYLEQIMIPLRKAGLVKARRGKKGGYMLDRPPERINTREVYKVLETPNQLALCLDISKECPLEPTCPAQKLWRSLSDCVNEVLERTTIRKLMEMTPESRSLLDTE